MPDLKPPDDCNKSAETGIVPKPKPVGITPILPDLPKGPATFHQAYHLFGSLSNWRSYSTQRHITDFVYDFQRKCLWLSTWGGVLRWECTHNRIERHNSAHGLSGNPTRCLALDNAGTLWAIGEMGGLSWLSLMPDGCWQSHPQLLNSKVIAALPAAVEGIYAIVRQADGRFSFCVITTEQFYELSSEPESVNLTNLLVSDGDGGIWAANLWGLHHYCSKQKCFDQHFPLPPGSGGKVFSLALGNDHCLWVGTGMGLYFFTPTARGESLVWQERNTVPLSSSIASLLIDSDTNAIWISTPGGVGFLKDDYKTVKHLGSPKGISVLKNIPEDQTGKNLTVGAISELGLYALSNDQWKLAFGFSTEDNIPFSVQCIWADDSGIWVGGLGGLVCKMGDKWIVVNEFVRPHFRDVRALVAPKGKQGKEQLLLAEWSIGLGELQNNVYIPRVNTAYPLSAISITPGGIIWASDKRSLYAFDTEFARSPVALPALKDKYVGAITTICATDDYIWVGTTNGLWRYEQRAKKEKWIYIDNLKKQAIFALAIHPQDCKLWIGGAVGLFCQDGWTQYSEEMVSAITFSANKDIFWVATAHGLHQWSYRKMKIRNMFRTDNSGLPSNKVTCLGSREINGKSEVWAGTSYGVCTFQWEE